MPIDYTHQHLSSSVMQEDDVHTPIDPAGGGSIERIGPFRVDFDTPGVNTSYVVLMPLDPGTLVLRVMAYDYGWHAEDGTMVTADIQTRTVPPTEPAVAAEVYFLNAFAEGGSPIIEIKDSLTAEPPRMYVGRAPDEGEYDLAAYVYVNGPGSPTAGYLDFYAIIAAA